MNMATIRVLIVEDNEAEAKALQAFLATKPSIEAVDLAHDGRTAKAMILASRPHVVILDLVLPIEDGFSVMMFLREKKLEDVKAIVLSGLRQDFTIQRALRSGACGYVIKSASFHDVYEHVMACQYMDSEALPDTRGLPPMSDEEALNVLLMEHFGLADRLLGTGYLRAAVEILRDWPKSGSTHCSITGTIYPRVAQQFDATPSQVERAIRNAIDWSWKKGNMRQCGLFAQRPSNGELIHRLAQRGK